MDGYEIQPMEVTTGVAPFVAAFFGRLGLLARDRGFFHGVRLLRSGAFLVADPIGKRIRAHAPTQGVHQKYGQ